MRTYTVHEPSWKIGDDALAHTSRFAFVRDGFHWWAFLLAPLWMLRHRLWIEFIVFALLIGGASFALTRLGVAESAGWVWLLAAWLVGIEASTLRRWKLARRGFENRGIVVGDDIEEAERRFFDGWVARDEEPRPAAPVIVSAPQSSPFGSPPSSDIVGLFPQPGVRP